MGDIYLIFFKFVIDVQYNSSPGAMFNWTCAFLVVYFYPIAETALNKYTCYFFFAAVCLFGAVFITLFVPETKGKTEEDMRNYFMKNINTDNKSQDNKGYE